MGFFCLDNESRLDGSPKNHAELLVDYFRAFELVLHGFEVNNLQSGLLLFYYEI